MKVRLTVEFNVEIDKEEYPDVNEKQVLDRICIYDDDVADGFLLTTNLAGFDNTCDFFLRNGRIAEKEILPENADIILENEERMEMTL